MHNGNYTSSDGKISSTELLKTADEIHNYLLKDVKECSQEQL